MDGLYLMIVRLGMAAIAQFAVHDMLAKRCNMMTIADIAKRLRISQACAYALVESKELAHYRIGLGRGRIRVSEEQLATYLEKRRVTKVEKPRTTPAKLTHVTVMPPSLS